MSSRFTLNSKHLILLFSICFLVSAYFNGVLWNQRAELVSTQLTAREELVHEQRLFDALNAAIKGLAPATPDDRLVRNLEQELVSFIIAAKADLPGRMLTLSSFNVSRGGTNQRGTSLGTMSAQVPRGGGLKATSIKLVGKYKNLRLFREYVAALKSHPVILSSITLERDNFTLMFHLIGK